jgi:hypothetical protein
MTMAQRTQQTKIATADQAGLKLLGFSYGGVTAAVMLVAAMIVMGHVDGRLSLDGPTPMPSTTAR